MNPLFWRRMLCFVAAFAAALSAMAADKGEECWKATFTEQLTGPVREQRT
jgi:hypothetical protein